MKLLDLFKRTKTEEQARSVQLTLEDVLAPAQIEIDFNHLRIDERFFKTYFVSNYPRFVEANWLEPLVSFNHSLLISMFIYPSESAGVLDELKRKIAEMQATIQTDFERNRAIDPTVEVALEDAQSLQDQLVKGVERFFQFSLYITVPSFSKEELLNTSKLVESTLASLSMTARPTTLQMEDGLRATLPLGLDLLNLTHNMDTTSLATTFPFASSELTANEGIMYGINEHNGSLILFDRFTLENANSVIFAKSGAGKSTDYRTEVLIQADNGTHKIMIGQLIEDLISKQGVQKIEEGIEGVINPNLKVWTFDKNLKGSWSTVTVAARKKFSPRNRLYTITTKSGREITITADHNLVILRKGRIRVMRSEALKIGEAIPLPRYVSNTSPAVNYINPKDLVEEWPQTLPETLSIDKSLLILLGLTTSEGLVRERLLRIFNMDSAVNLIVEKHAKVLGARTSILKSRGLDTGRAITPYNFAQLFTALGAGGKSGEKHVPPILFSLSNKQIAHYLQAYFEGDGGVESHSVAATTKSPQLASDLSYLLLQFGIIARISPRLKAALNTVNKTKNTYYQVTISGKDNLLKFAEQIGFLTESKNNKLWQLLQKSSIANTNIDTIPTLQPIFNYLYKTLFPSSQIPSPTNLSPLKRGVFNPSPQELNRFIMLCEKRLEELRLLNKPISLLSSLPSLSELINRGSKNRKLNGLLWKTLGQSWRIMKNAIHPPLIKNALLAYQTIYGQSVSLLDINTALYDSFKFQGTSLRSYDKSLWSSIVTRKTGNSRYSTIVGAAKFITKKYSSTAAKIRFIEKKLEQLKILANSDLFWDPIVKIERIKHKEKYVYDLQVDNGVFLAGHGGMFVHNSYLVKLEALRSLMFGVEIIVIDPEQEYLSLAQAVGGEYINFSASSPAKINPFDISNQLTTGENELGRKILSLTVFLKLVLGNLTATEGAILDRALKQTYHLKGITDDPKTQINPASGMPLMEDLYKVLVGMEEAQATELSARLEKFIKGSLTGIFSAQSNLDLSNAFTVFSVRDLPDQLRPLAIHMILDYVWTKIRGKLKRRIMIVDEAWYLMRNPDSAEFLVDMAKRARKYYLGLTTITQDVEDFLTTERGKEIISNSSIQMLLKQAPASIDLLADVFNLSEGEQRLLMSEGVGQGLFFAGNTHVAMRIVASPQEHELVTSNPAELMARQKV